MTPRYVFLLPVWGAAYIDRFLSFSLPTLLSPGNLPALPVGRSAFKVFTTSQDVEPLLGSPAFRALVKQLPMSVELLDGLDFSHPWNVMSEAYNRGLRGAARHTASVFLCPDVLWSDGSFRRMDEIVQEGKRTVLICGLRVEAKACRDNWPHGVGEGHYGEGAPGRPVVVTCPPRRLMAFALRHLHPISQAFFCGPDGNRSLGHYFWPAGRNAILARCFHVHPLVVWPRRRGIEVRSTVDHDYVRLCCPDPRDLHLVTDSDEIAALEFSEAEHMGCLIEAGPIPTDHVLDWAYKWTNVQHRLFARQSIHFHAGKTDPAAWAAAERQAEAYVGGLLEQFRQRYPRLRFPGVLSTSEPLPARPSRGWAWRAVGLWRRLRLIFLPPAIVSRAHYLSPFFLARKVREKGFVWCVKKGVHKVSRKLGWRAERPAA